MQIVDNGPNADKTCEHGVALDVHCCGCHSGFLFDRQACVCLSDGLCEREDCQHRVCQCDHAECEHANENVQPNCAECDCAGFVETAE